MKDKLNHWIKNSMRLLLRLFWLFPIKNNRVFFANFCTPKYACNPKYITEYLAKHYPGIFEFVWMADIPEEICQEKKIRTVKRNSLTYFYFLLTSKVFVSNAGMPTYIPFRKKQLTVATWHGGGAYKHVGVNIPGVSQIQYREFEKASQATGLFLSSSRAFTETVIRQAFLYKGKVLEYGMPRNDILLSSPQDIARRVRKRYGVAEETKIILYAPTYRGDFFHASNEGAEADDLDVQACIAAAQKRFGGTWCLFYRAHHAITSHRANIACIDVGDYPDMQELLCTVDMLITDYSSSMWDFSLTEKPGFLFATDVQKYKDERDFDTPMSEWPYVVTTNNAELVDAIETFDGQLHIDKVRNHLQALGSCETGHAAQTVGDYLYRFCLEGEKK